MIAGPKTNLNLTEQDLKNKMMTIKQLPISPAERKPHVKKFEKSRKSYSTEYNFLEQPSDQEE